MDNRADHARVGLLAARPSRCSSGALALPRRCVDRYIFEATRADYCHEDHRMQHSALGWSRAVDWPARCAELDLQKGSRVDIVYYLKTKANPQFPGLELQLIDLRPAAPR